MAKMAKPVVVFDFDKTIIDCDSDNWLLDELGFTDLFNQILATMPWNPTMDRMMKEMHEKGVTINEIEEVLKRTPMHNRIIPAIKSAYDAGCDLRILSDANRFYIETILKHHGMEDYFSEIHTNPGYVDEDGRLRIFPHHDYNTTPHGCDCILCPPNMCKGMVMEKLISQEENKTFIYLGDGNGDYCPSMKLRKVDYCMPRKNFPLWDVISSNPKLITSSIHEWTDGGDLERVLLSLTNSIISPTKDQNKETTNNNSNSNNGIIHIFPRVDCKLIHESRPMGGNSHEALPPALSVPR